MPPLDLPGHSRPTNSPKGRTRLGAIQPEPDGVALGEADGGADASQWIVKEKSGLKFADVAGLDDVKEDIRLKMIYPFEHPELAMAD